MNNTNNTEELLKTIDLTLEDIIEIIKKGVNGRYRSFKILQETTTKEDLEQDVLLYYLSTMKSTGDIRLNHYIKKYHDRQHIINLVKQTAYQLPIYFLRSKEIVNRAVSIDALVETAKTETPYSDVIEDVRATKEIHENLSNVDMLNVITEELNDTNFQLMKDKYNKTKNRESKISLLFDVQDYIDTYNAARHKTLVQLQIIKDLCNGYSRKELLTKYNTYLDDIKIIKQVIKNNLKTYFATSF